jgi:hypothetical protein
MTVTATPLTVILNGGSVMLTIFIVLCIFIGSFLLLAVRRIHHDNSKQTAHFITLDTRIGCPTGYCYLSMITRGRQYHMCQRLGPFPTIRELLTVPKSYRTKTRRGTLEFIADGVLHFEEDVNGENIWMILEYAATHNDIITNRVYTKLDSSFPIGFRYLQLIHPDHRQFISAIYGRNPFITLLNSTPANCRAPARGVILEQEENSLRFVYAKGGIDAWHQVFVWSQGKPEARIGM